MDKKDKILIAIAPFALGAVGYMFFGKSLNSDSPVQAESDFTSIEAPVTETRKKRTELYRDKYEKENAEKFKRKIENDDLFFADEVTPANTDSINPLEPAREPSIEVVEVVQGNQAQIAAKKLKPRSIIKYVERPVEKRDSVVVQAAVEPVKRVRRAGFVSQASSIQPKTTEDAATTVTDLAIPVVIQETVDVKNGSNIQLRTIEEIKLNGIVVPKNTLVTGIVAITQERINVKVNTIKGASRTVQMKLSAYDLDGNEGIPVEGGVNKEIKKDVVGSAIQETGRIVNVPILNRLPTTSSGNKKINDPVIPVPKGYKLVLKQEVK